MYPGQNRLAILFLFTVLVRHLSMSVLEKSLVRIFRVCCLLFSYQCSFLLLPFHATAFILYQSVSCLSTTFLNYFLSLFLNLSNSNSDILSYIFLLVNNFFEVFFRSYFQTKRRKRDSNPRAGCPTYTLSRGASSASWVFLLSPIQGLYLTVCLHTFNVTSQRIDNYT